MKNFILSVGLVLILLVSFGCDSDNNVIAQDDDLPGAMEPEAITMVTGKIIDPGAECDGMLDGFTVGDEITIKMNDGSGEDLPSRSLDNTTTGQSVDCGGNSTINDGPPLSVLVCASENSQISSFTNGNFMSMLVSFSWEGSFLDDITNSAYIIAQNIDFVQDQDIKKVPCARVQIESIMASN